VQALQASVFVSLLLDQEQQVKRIKGRNRTEVDGIEVRLLPAALVEGMGYETSFLTLPRIA
jgi:hypothetical protein